ncbi:HupE/UreJ family protein [Pseudaquabacterium pictum]|uniref:Membrane protein n=1 Tax=Pseudaquabacterium pictum TaxID=2315236 RepID=A0A480AL65_9BURK|nr:HupE/UreJ family protein [Rubrivivax pictus]GCL62459.1 membrane protein [Rubrivivax pictus]
MNRRLAWLPALWPVLWLLLAGAPAQAHKPSDSYLTLAADGAVLTGRWDIALRDLDLALGLDADGDGRITWGEVRSRHADIAGLAQAHLALRADGQACSLVVGPQQVDEHTDGAYSVLPLTATCPRAPVVLDVGYSLFADLDPQHRGLLNLAANGATRAAILGPQAPQQAFTLAQVNRWRQFIDYAADGVWHIWIGFDHILFLLSLLLPAVGTWAARGVGHQRAVWQPVPRLGVAVWEVLRIVTAFTLAHSITLSLATLGWVTLPSRLVEATIAASVVLAALNNVWPFFQGRRWAVAFGFGLVHGFGFASVLADLGLPREALALALVGFNLGVEAGQLAIVAVFLPLAYLLRRSLFYRRVVLWGGSLAIAALAAAWFVERAFDLQLLPF